MDRQDGASPPSLKQTSVSTEKDGTQNDQLEERLWLLAEEGYGYYPAASFGHRLGQSPYEIVRKVCPLFHSSTAAIDPPVAWMGSLLHGMALPVGTALYTWCST
jgi:hypothetical protein